MPQHGLPSALERLKQAGHRMTPARTAIVQAVLGAGRPVSAQEVLSVLKNRNVAANVTTIYRELEFLREEGIIVPVSFADGVQRYESAALGHHHHLICVECQEIQDVTIPNESLDAAERGIKKTHAFTVLQHTLDFYGHCKRCRSGAA